MKKNSDYIKFLFIGFCCFITAYFFPFVIPGKILSGINDLPYWWIYSLSRKSLGPLKIVGIAIDEYSLDKIQQRWPWRRPIYAQIIDTLDKNGVNTIGIDLVLKGESDIKEDDGILTAVLDKVKSRVVLASLFDYKTQTPILPLRSFAESCYALGMVDTPADKDGKVRRLRPFLKFEDKIIPSFTVQVASSFLGRPPQKIIPSIPLLKDNTFLVNYLIKPGDILKLSFYDVLRDPEALKAKYGKDFLKGALVLIYAEAEVIHDTVLTPFGYMPGGLLNINGISNIVFNRFITESRILAIPFLVISFLLIFCFLQLGFLQGFVFTLGLFILNFWLLVFMGLKGLKYNYAQAVIFGTLFFTVGSLYKYIYFFAQLLKIKDKATLDPLRGIFTSRYFYYRLELESNKVSKKRYFGKDLFLVFVYLESFKEEFEGAPLEKLRDIWQKIKPVIYFKDSFWSVYSQEELIGCMASPAAKINPALYSLKNNLGSLFKERDIKCKVKLGCLRLNKKYPLKELAYILSVELRKNKEEIVLFKDSDLVNLLGPSDTNIKEGSKLLDSLDEDIEEKNRQFLSLLENLEKEHAKTKEAFFQIITSLVNALEARDPYTQGHSERVCNYALMTAERLGWNRAQKEKLQKAALLHDIGKIGIPDSILHKKGQLKGEELDFIRKHELIGVKILEPLKEINEILPWIMYHHERWDGKGYPHGLAGSAIPEAASLIALADVFDALTTGRDYKTAFSRDDALKEIIKNKGTQFNPGLTDIFVKVMLKSQK